ncbi:MAG: hypothetical protein FWF22_09080 [Treponema sp.]|nr:hypothetical protein [Treponema sp.]
MKNKKQRKILFFLALGSLILFVGLLTEFTIHRYATNRSVSFKSEGTKIQIFQDRKWQEFNVQGVIIGADRASFIVDASVSKDEYSRWFKQLVGMGINMVQVYTIQHPAFYQAFFEYNMLTNRPLYLMQGIYIEDDYIQNYKNAYSEQLISDYFEEIRRTVDVVHGRAVIKPRTGYASGTYNMNIAPYVMGYILYGKTDTDFINQTNEKNMHVIGFEGDYLYTENASPYEAWFTGVGNYVISYEQDNYRGPYKLMSWSGISTSTVHSTEKYNAGVLVLRDDFPHFPSQSSDLHL